MLTRLQAREEKEKGGIERRRGVRRSNQSALLSSVLENVTVEGEVNSCCAGLMCTAGANNVFEGEQD
jgi:hypothetical protein